MRPLRLALALAAALALATATARAQAADVLIRGGTVVDGTGAPERRADVAITGDRITFVGDAARAGLRAARTIDAAGLVVAPGFVDPHAHVTEDLSSPDASRRANLAYLMQGVTTTVTGNDGHGRPDVGATLARWRERGIGTNGALLVGHGAVRGAVMRMSDAAPTSAELDSMRALVARAMDEGALGLSSGLYYAPGSYAATGEVVALAKVAAAKGGLYDSHLRDESSYTPAGLIGAVAEAIRIAREARLPVNISHIKALGADVHGRSDSVIALVRAARAEGLVVTADQYPYEASGSGIGASLLPRWAQAGGRDSLLARIASPATRARLVRDMTDNLRRRGGAASLLITSARDTTLVGRTLEQVARARDVDPISAALDIIVGIGDASVASFNMTAADIERFMREDWVTTGSDGSAGHPRKYGTFPRKLREYVYGKRLLTLPEFVQRSSARTARTFGLADRGTLEPGKYADVIVFDPATVADRATYQQPALLATGMRWVFVNGIAAVEHGAYTGAMAGRALARAGAAGAWPASTQPPLDLSAYRMVDLSHSFNAQTLYWPTSPSSFKLDRLAFGPTAGGFFYSANQLSTPEHGGTHLDAPIHFAEGKHTSDQVPLERLVAPAVVIDVADRAAADRDYRLTREDVLSFERRHGRIRPGTFVVLRTGWSRFWPDRKAYLGDDTPNDASKLHFPAFGADAARLLVEERRVGALGADVASIDYGPSQDFIVHRIAMGANVPAIENLTNLAELPPTGALLIALPMKIEGGSGGPARAMALVPRR